MGPVLAVPVYAFLGYKILGDLTQTTVHSTAKAGNNEPYEFEIGISIHPQAGRRPPGSANVLLHVQVLRQGRVKRYQYSRNMWGVIYDEEHTEETRGTAPIIQRLVQWDGAASLPPDWVRRRILPLVAEGLAAHGLSLDTFLPGAMQQDPRLDHWGGAFRSHARICSKKQPDGTWRLQDPEFDFPLPAAAGAPTGPRRSLLAGGR